MQNFSDFGLSAPVLKAISEMGIETPTPIQAQTLPLLLGEPTDILGLAATGTGKTAAFSLPLIEKMDVSRPGVQALILCPTRELALQVTGQVELMGKYKGIHALPIYGGAGYDEQNRGLRRGVPVVVGTPGRIADHLRRGTLKLDSIETVILDEADEMISMGFKEEMEAILSAIPEEQRRIWLFSATMSPGVRKVADTFLRDPQTVQVNRKEMLSDKVEQIYYVTQESNKPEVLCKLIDLADDFYGLIFFQTKSLVIDATDYLRARGYQVESLHGDLSQSERERAMQLFRDRAVNMLLCTDVASRGLDVKDITHVINYSIPRELDSYVHRIGRTARSGKSGLALSLVTPANRALVRKIEDMTKSRMREGVIPSRKEVAAKKVSRFLAKFSAQNDFIRASEHLGADWLAALEGMAPTEIAGRFLSLMYPETFTINAPGADQRVKHFVPENRDAGPSRRSDRGDRYVREERAPRPRPSSEHYGVLTPPKPLATPAAPKAVALPKPSGEAPKVKPVSAAPLVKITEKTSRPVPTPHAAPAIKMKLVLPKDRVVKVGFGRPSLGKKKKIVPHANPVKAPRPHFKERQQARELLEQARKRSAVK